MYPGVKEKRVWNGFAIVWLHYQLIRKILPSEVGHRLEGNATQSVVLVPAASESPWSSGESQTLGPTPDLTNQTLNCNTIPQEIPKHIKV